MKAKILLVDDSNLILEAIRALLEKYQEIDVVGDTNTIADVAKLTNQLSPDVIIMGVALTRFTNDITSVIRQIATSGRVKIIVLSENGKVEYVRNIIHAGAQGYLLKTCTTDELIEAIQTVMRDGVYFTPEVSKIMMIDYVNYIRHPVQSRQFNLSARELEVLRFLALGDNSKEIGAQLHISSKTVDAHKRRLMSKLNISNLAELVKFAIRNEIIDMGE